MKVSQPIPKRHRLVSAVWAAAATVLFTVTPAVVMRGAGILGVHAVSLAMGCLALAAFGEGVLASPDRHEISPSERWSAIFLNGIHGGALLASLTAALVGSAATAVTGIAIVGATVMVAGAGLRIWAVATLADHFGDGFRLLAVKPSQTGPYRYLRHPAEAGLWLFILGFTTTVSAWSGQVVVFLLPLLACSLIRLRAEECALVTERSSCQ